MEIKSIISIAVLLGCYGAMGASYTYTTKSFEVPLDHFSFVNNKTFHIRYDSQPQKEMRRKSLMNSILIDIWRTTITAKKLKDPSFSTPEMRATSNCLPRIPVSCGNWHPS